MLKNKYSETLGCLDEKNLLLTEAYFNFRSIQENLLEIYYEEYGFDRISLMTPASLVGFKDHLINPNNLSSLIVDSGYSYTHIIPIVKGKIRKGDFLPLLTLSTRSLRFSLLARANSAFHTQHALTLLLRLDCLPNQITDSSYFSF